MGLLYTPPGDEEVRKLITAKHLTSLKYLGVEQKHGSVIFIDTIEKNNFFVVYNIRGRESKMKRFTATLMLLTLIFSPLAYAQTSEKGDLVIKKDQAVSLMSQMSITMKELENSIAIKSKEKREGVSRILKDMSIQFKDMSMAFDKGKISDKEMAVWNERVTKMRETHLGSAQMAEKEGVKGVKKDVMVDLMDRMSVVITNISEVIQRDKDHVLIAKVMMDMSKQLNEMSMAVKKDKVSEKAIQTMLDREADIRAKVNSM